jgi:hypothetical protein
MIWRASVRFFAIGVVLVAFSLYSLIRPKLPSASGAGRVTDGMVGMINGALGGATGLPASF